MLWVLSRNVSFDVGGVHVAIPGYMVWCALAYSLVGTVLTWLVGRPLIRLNDERYEREAELRFALMRVSERAEAIGQYGGETDERRILDETVRRLLQVGAHLGRGLGRRHVQHAGPGALEEGHEVDGPVVLGHQPQMGAASPGGGVGGHAL